MNPSAHCYYQTHPGLRVCGLLTLVSCYQSHLGPWWAPQAPAGINPECSDGCRASGNTGLTQPKTRMLPRRVQIPQLSGRLLYSNSPAPSPAAQGPERRSPLPGAPARGRGLLNPAHLSPRLRCSPGEGLSGWRQPPSAPLPSLGKSLRFEALSWVWEKSWRAKPAGKLPSVKCRTSAGAAKVSMGESGDGGSEEGRDQTVRSHSQGPPGPRLRCM